MSTMSTMNADGAGSTGNSDRSVSADDADEMRFDDLAAVGADERTIAVARALAEARREAPASLAGVRWAAVAENEQDAVANEREAMTASTTMGSKSSPGDAGSRLPLSVPRRHWARGAGWMPPMLIGAAGVALALALWVWVWPWLEATTVGRPEGAVAPAKGEWTLVEQFGGETLALAKDTMPVPVPVAGDPVDGAVTHGHAHVLVGRGQRVEMYDAADVDASGRPRLVAVSPLLPGRPIALALVGEAVYAGIEGQKGLWVLRVPDLAPGAATPPDQANVVMTLMQVVPTDEPVMRLSAAPGGDATVDIAALTSPGEDSGSLTLFRANHLGWFGIKKQLGGWRTDYQGLRDIAIVGTVVYAAASSGIHVIDVSDPSSPRDVGVVAETYSFNVLAADGMRLYAAGQLSSDYQVVIFERTDPLRPTVAGTYDAGEGSDESIPAISADHDTLAVSVQGMNQDGNKRVELVDVRDPATPRRLKYVSSMSESIVLTNDVLLQIMPTWGGGQPMQFTVNDRRWIDASKSRTSMVTETTNLGSPFVLGLSPWAGGVLASTWDEIIGGQVAWPDAAHAGGKPPTGAPAPDGSVPWIDRSRAWAVPPWSDSDGIVTVAAQAAHGDRAAALLLRDRQDGRYEVGLVTWTAGEDLSRWPRRVADIGDRIAWQPFERPSGGDELDAAEWIFVDKVGWQLTVNDRFAAAVFNLEMDGQRLLVFDVSDPAHPRPTMNVVDTDLANANMMALNGARLFAGDSDRISVLDIHTGTQPTRLADFSATQSMRDIAFTDDGVLILGERGLEYRAFGSDGLPIANGPATLIAPLNAIEPDTPGGMQLAVDGTDAYVAGYTIGHYLAYVCRIDLRTHQVAERIDLEPNLFDEWVPEIVVTDNRIYVYSTDAGVLIFERRPSRP